MRRKPASSVRSVAFVAAFCALAVAAGCGRVSFDLVPEQTLDSAAAGHGAGTLEVSLGGNSLASAGKAGGGSAGNGLGGSGGSGGSGGRLNTAGYGRVQHLPLPGRRWLRGRVCPPYSSSPFCTGCYDNDDCASNDDAKVCNTDTKRCVQCWRDPDNCGIGQACNPFTQRCATCVRTH